MRRSGKPVRKCHSCVLNLGDHCWLYAHPRGQWRGSCHCPAMANPQVHERFREWQRQPTVKTRKELRREAFRTRRQRYVPPTEHSPSSRRRS